MDYERLPESSESFIYVAIDPSDGKAHSPWWIVFGQFLERHSRKYAAVGIFMRLWAPGLPFAGRTRARVGADPQARLR